MSVAQFRRLWEWISTKPFSWALFMMLSPREAVAIWGKRERMSMRTVWRRGWVLEIGQKVGLGKKPLQSFQSC